MSRRPTKPPGADDAALWARVAASVRPLGSGAAPAPERALPRVRVRIAPPEPPGMSAQRQALAPGAASLDGGWDRRVRTGRIEPERTVDLHGHSRDAAYAELSGAIESAWQSGIRTLLVITGKIRPAANGDPERGVIASNLPVWLEAPRLRPFVAALRRAHPRHGGGGAWYVILRRKR